MKYQLKELEVESIILDLENPRIAFALQTYGENINAEAIALALSNSSDADSTGTTVRTLQDSIKASGGISSPIVVNHHNNTYTVIEGNTRVQIYKDFIRIGTKGDWKTIPALVYEDMDHETMTAIRLQAHMIGQRPWNAYSKAKYLHKLNNEENLSIDRIIDICGGKRQEIRSFIQAYNDMEKYYHQKVDDQDFDVKEFSAFRELNEHKVCIDALQANGFTKDDFGDWVIKGKLGKAQNVRYLAEVLNSPEGKKVFLQKNLDAAINLVHAPKTNNVDLPIEVLADVLSKKLASLPFTIYKTMKEGGETQLTASLVYLKENLDNVLDFYSEDQ